MSEAGEITMSSTTTQAPNVPSQSQETAGPSMGQFTPDKLPVDETPATLKDVKDSTPFDEYKDKLEPQDPQNENDPEKTKKSEVDEDANKSEEQLRDELQELQQEYSNAFGGDTEQEGESDEIAAAKKELKQKEKPNFKIVVDTIAELKRMLSYIFAILKRFMFKNLITPDAPIDEKVTGKTVEISKGPHEGPENERKAMELGYKKRSQADAVKEFEGKTGTQSELLAEAGSIFGDTLYKMEPDEKPKAVEEIFEKNHSLRERIQKKTAALTKRVIARKIKA